MKTSPILHPSKDSNIFVTGDLIRPTNFKINGKYTSVGSLFGPNGDPSAPDQHVAFNPNKGDKLSLSSDSLMKKNSRAH